ncbi:hypothetical protein AMJ57_01315, partial [Parcubacteria bacterium SG8_24]
MPTRTRDNRIHRATGGGSRGVSILEALLSLAIFGILAAGVLIFVIGPLDFAGGSGQRERAVFLAEEGIAAVRSVRNDGWTGLAAGTYGLSKSTGKWAFSGTSDITDIFTREIVVEAVNRDVSGDIVTSGGTPDPRTRRVTSRVSWNPPLGVAQSVELSAYLSDWNVFDWKQTTDADFSGGTTYQTQVAGSGEGASIQLMAGGGGDWTPSEGQLIL